jgi:hypothetical protein
MINPGKKMNRAWPEKPKLGELFFPDAFADEKVYFGYWGRDERSGDGGIAGCCHSKILQHAPG